MTTEAPTRTKLGSLFATVADKLKSLDYVEVTPREFQEAVHITLWHIWYGDPKSLVSKVRAVAAGYGLEFKIDVAVDGRDRVTFTRINEKATEALETLELDECMVGGHAGGCRCHTEKPVRR